MFVVGLPFAQVNAEIRCNNTVPYHTIPCHAMPYHTASYCITPHHITPYHAQSPLTLLHRRKHIVLARDALQEEPAFTSRSTIAIAPTAPTQELLLSYSLRRYAGAQSYVLPYDANSPEYVADMGPLPASEAIVAANTYADYVSTANVVNAAREGKGFRRATRSKSFGSSKKSSLRTTNSEGRHQPEEQRSRREAARADDPDAAETDAVNAAVVAAALAGGGVFSKEATSPSTLTERMVQPEVRGQFRELAARGGRFAWNPAQCPSELVLLVVNGKRQAELLGPLYRELEDVAAAGSSREGYGDRGTEVFIAMVRL